MAYEGYVDDATDQEIRGWVFDDGAKDEPLLLEIVAGDVVVARIKANQYRKDLQDGGKGNGKHGFTFKSDKPADRPLSARIPGRRWVLPFSNASREPMRIASTLRHSLEFGRPPIPNSFSQAKSRPNEPAIAERLITAFHRTKSQDPMRQSRKADVWSELANHYHTDLAKLLEKKNAVGVAGYLREAHSTNLTFGITQGEHTTNVLRARADAREFESVKYADYLVSLAESLGLLDEECPEQVGRWAENLHMDLNQLMTSVEKEIGITIVPPQVMGSLFGITTPAGVLSGRDLLGLYAGIRLKQIGLDLQLQNPSICEIGGGIGQMAFYAFKLGLTQYTLIDLPMINVLQGYYLLSALSEQSVCLYGETPSSVNCVRVLPFWCFNEQNVRYSLLVNMDSFPEIHGEYVLAYLRQARQNVTSAFLSINQEARAPQYGAQRQTAVRDLVKQVGGFRTASRFRHWLRAGYVEELFRVLP